MQRMVCNSLLTAATLLILGELLCLTGFVELPALRAQQSVKRATIEKWEYCAITQVDYNNATRSYTVFISYPGNTDQGVKKIELPLNTASPVITVAEKLGADGWEMVGGEGYLNLGAFQSRGIYFKRAIRQ